ncbi:MAG: ABC transporter permease [Woeseiaceae bacterium]|nr:ABC transporter permease [Woeseiaceae bacterium]
MEIRPILSAMWRNRTGSVLVAVQIALTLAIVVNCMFMAKSRIEFIARPSGMDIENIITAQSLGFGSDYRHDETIDADLRALRALPGVIAVTPASGIPMSGSGSATGYKTSMDEDAPRETANYYRFDEHAEQALGVKIIEGRGFTELEVRRADDENYDRMPPQVIITKAYAERLFGDEPALGQLIYDGLNESAEVVGIIEHQYGAWVHWSSFDNVMWFPQRQEGPSIRYIIRAEPGQRDALIPVVEQTMQELNSSSRLVRNVRTMEETVATSYEGDFAIASTLIVAIILLFVITGLGIVGLASFTVRQRTKQIGTRRAIGARKRDIIRYFLTENWLMTTIGIVIGTVLTISLNYALATAFEIERLNYVYLVIGMGMLWLLGFVAVAEPARRASNVSPAVATRTV